MSRKDYEKAMKILENPYDDTLSDLEDECSFGTDFLGHKVSRHLFNEQDLCQTEVGFFEVTEQQYDGNDEFDSFDEGRRAYWGELHFGSDIY
jgi:hypothetical protein